MKMQNLDGFTISPATTAVAGDLANFVVLAGDGLPLILWESLRGPGETVMDVGRRRALRDEGAFSYRNADIAVRQGEVVAALVSYPIHPDTDPEPLQDLPELFRPLAALENKTIASWYINVLATYPAARRQGIASALLTEAERKAREAGFDRLSLIVADTNPARSLYERSGFRASDHAAMVKDGWAHPGRDWILMIKPIG